MILNKRYLLAMFSYPLTLWVIAIIIIISTAFIYWFHAPLLIAISIIALSLGLLVLWLFMLKFSQDFKQWYYSRIREFSRHELARFYQLESEFKRSGYNLAHEQLFRLQNTVSEFRSLISRRLDDGSSNFVRLLPVTENFFRYGIDNLEKLLTLQRAEQPESDIASQATLLLDENERALSLLTQAKAELSNARSARNKATLQSVLAELSTYRHKEL